MKFLKNFVVKIIAAFAVAFFVPLFVLAAPIYSPGQTLNPSCLPSNTDCTVTTPAISGANSDITSLTAVSSITLGTLNGLLQASSGLISASTSPTVNYITSTSTTATSTFNYGVNLSSGGCFAVAGVCISGGSSTSQFSLASDSRSIYNTLLGSLLIGTTTTNRLAMVDIASTVPSLVLTNTAGALNQKHFLMNYSAGIFQAGSENDAQTSTTTSFSIDTTGPGSMNIGSTTYANTGNINDTFEEGTLVLGRNGTNGSTTMMMGKAQWDMYTNSGQRFCMWYIQPGVIASSTGACTH